MDNNVVVKVNRVSKTFRLPHDKNTSIKGAVVNFYKGRHSYEEQRALKDVSFEVKKGEFFGIVGKNGSGKSTLLKMLAGIYLPTSGEIHINGKLTPFIELGVGFNMELTGRENIFLNGSLLGFSRKEMQAMYDDIVSFAELPRFMDQKLKNYSSGMQVRLAFSIAIRANPEILLLDEVLAVGDVAFQDKCFDYFYKLKREKTTIILVTHDMAAINKFCDRAMMINGGKVVVIGSPRKVSTEYLRINAVQTEKTVQAENLKNQKKYDTRVLLSRAGNYRMGETAKIEIRWPKSSGNIKNVGVALFKNSGEYVFGANTKLDKYTLKDNKLVYEVALNVGPGAYHFKVGLFGKDTAKVIEFIDEGPRVTVVGDKLKWEGISYLEHKWG